MASHADDRSEAAPGASIPSADDDALLEPTYATGSPSPGAIPSPIQGPSAIPSPLASALPSAIPNATAQVGAGTGPGGLSPAGPTYLGQRTPPPGAPQRPYSSSGGAGSVGAVPPMFVGRVLAGRWEVGQRIGLGGMASVHEGMDHRLGRAVAVKILHPHIAENEDSRERLAREARAIAQLKHENVIEVYDYSIDDPECTWLVSELIDGPSLRQLLDRNEKPLPEVAVMITTEVVRALRAAHGMGIVHRDVKPDNILVGSAGRPKLSDFGIAQVVNEHRMTLTGNLVGSPSYMSPEQANGKRTDHRTDLFSAGILLYRLVTGTLPFRGATAIETIRKVSIGEYIDPVELEPGSSGAVAGIIRRALLLPIEERYQSADELLRDLTAVLQDSGLSATWEELPKFFEDPAGYQAALRPRLAKELEARGRALLDAGEEGRAVDCFNRALSLGEGNQRTHDLVRELSKRRGQGRVRRFVWATAVALGAVAIVGGILLATERLPLGSEPAPLTAPIADEPTRGAKDAPIQAAAQDPTAQDPTAQDPAAAGEAPPNAAPEQGVEHAARAEHAEPKAAKVPAEPSAKHSSSAEGRAAPSEKKAPAVVEPRSTIIAAGLPPRDPPVKEEAKANVAAVSAESYGTLQVGTNLWADIYVDGKKLGRAPERSRYPLTPGVHHLRAAQPNCIPDEKEFTISAGETKRLRVKITCP